MKELTQRIETEFFKALDELSNEGLTTTDVKILYNMIQKEVYAEYLDKIMDK